jgi:hypothetical protein
LNDFLIANRCGRINGLRLSYDRFAFGAFHIENYAFQNAEQRKVRDAIIFHSVRAVRFSDYDCFFIHKLPVLKLQKDRTILFIDYTFLRKNPHSWAD